MTLWPIAVYLIAVVAITAGMLGLSHVLGQRHREPETDLPYEGGIAAYGTARIPVAAPYYLVAMMFVIFDLEAVFVFAWAVAARESGWTGFVEIAVFVFVLAVGLVWLWRTGALDWSPQARARRAETRRPAAARRFEEAT
jgi:NADH-quinone oxidoreductase subunit A